MTTPSPYLVADLAGAKLPYAALTPRQLYELVKAQSREAIAELWQSRLKLDEYTPPMTKDIHANP